MKETFDKPGKRELNEAVQLPLAVRKKSQPRSLHQMEPDPDKEFISDHSGGADVGSDLDSEYDQNPDSSIEDLPKESDETARQNEPPTRIAINRSKKDKPDSSEVAPCANTLPDSIDELLVIKSLQPGNREVCQKLAMIYVSRHEIGLAIDEFRLLSLKYPREDSYPLSIARLCVGQKDLERASQYYEKTLKVNPVLKEALLEYGNLLLEHGQLEQAVTVLERAKLIANSSEDSFLVLASAYQSLGQTTKAIENLKQANRLNPDNVEVKIKLGEIYSAEELYPQALQIVASLPDHGDLGKLKLTIQIDCMIGESRYDEASKQMELYLKRYPNDQVLQRKRIHLSRMLQLWDEVEEHLKELFVMESTYPVHRELSQFLLERGEYEKLEKLLLEAKQLFPREGDVSYQLSLIYKADQPAQAMREIERAIKLREGVEDWCFLKGELLVRLGKHSHAMKWFRSMQERFGSMDFESYVRDLIDRDKRYRKTYKLYQKAEGYLVKNEFKKALESFRVLVGYVPDNPDWLEQLGNLASFDGNYPEALQAYENALEFAQQEKKPRLGRKLFHLSYVFNDFEKAHRLSSEFDQQSAGEMEFEVHAIRVQRHLLAERSLPVEHFEELMAHYQNQASANRNQAVPVLCNGFSFLFLGSHLLDSELWTARAREIFQKVLKTPDFIRYHTYAYEGLYQVSLMDFVNNELKDILGSWVKVDSSIKVQLLYILELERSGFVLDALDFARTALSKEPENLELRTKIQELKARLWQEAGSDTDQKVDYLESLQKDIVEDPDNYLLYFDLTMALIYFSREFSTQSLYKRVEQVMRKTLKLKQNSPELRLQFLEVIRFSSGLSAREATRYYAKAKLHLERSLSEFPLHEGLMFELAKLCLAEDEDKDQGLRLLFKVASMNPYQVEVNAHLADYYLELGERTKAYHYYLKVIDRPCSAEVFESVIDKLQRLL